MLTLYYVVTRGVALTDGAVSQWLPQAKDSEVRHDILLISETIGAVETGFRLKEVWERYLNNT